MKTRDDVLDVFGGLGAFDRQWIIDRLSPSARATLLDDSVSRTTSTMIDSKVAGATPPLVAPGDESTQAAAIARLEAASARSIVAMLSGEPSWVLHALLQGSSWPWREEVLRLTDPLVRGDIARLDAVGVRYADKLVSELVVEASRLVVDHRANEERSAVSVWFQSLGSAFARHRLRMRA